MIIAGSLLDDGSKPKLKREQREIRDVRRSDERFQCGMGLPHSMTLARGSRVRLRPRGCGVRQPHVAFSMTLTVHWASDSSTRSASECLPLLLFKTPAFVW